MFHKISWDPVCHIESHDDVIKWKHFPCNWPFVRGIHRSPVNFQHKDQWRRAFRFSLICAWINRWVDNREDGERRRNRAHYDVTVMILIGQRMYWMCSNSKIPTKRYGIYDYDINIYMYIYIQRATRKYLCIFYKNTFYIKCFNGVCFGKYLKYVLWNRCITNS